MERTHDKCKGNHRFEYQTLLDILDILGIAISKHNTQVAVAWLWTN
jgi:hypothetical protein